MMMGLFRKFNRKKQKEFNYEEYNRRKQQEAETKRKARAKEPFKKAWRDAVQESVPILQLWLAQFIPPVWYKNLIMKLLDLINRHADKYVQSVSLLNISYFRKSFTMYTIAYGIRLITLFLIGWLRWIHDAILFFGINTSFTEKEVVVRDKKVYRYTMRVRYFFHEILYKEMDF
jgi:hypothetical protein